MSDLCVGPGEGGRAACHPGQVGRDQCSPLLSLLCLSQSQASVTSPTASHVVAKLLVLLLGTQQPHSRLFLLHQLDVTQSRLQGPGVSGIA